MPLCCTTDKNYTSVYTVCPFNREKGKTPEYGYYVCAVVPKQYLPSQFVFNVMVMYLDYYK